MSTILAYFQVFINYIIYHINYFWVVVLMTIESSFIPFPSEGVIPPAAYKAYHGDLNIFIVFLAATLGSLLGALFNYYLAKYLGKSLVYKFADSKLGKVFLLSKDKIEQAEEYFVKKGAMSTFIGRLIPGIRQLISIPAGLAGMPIMPFIYYTLLGSGLWNAFLCALGYYLASIYTVEKMIEEVALRSKEIGIIIIAIVLVYFIYKYFTSKKKNNK